MKQKRTSRIHPNRFLFRIVITVMVTVLLMMTAFSVLLYANIERLVKENEEVQSRKLLTQINRNITQLDSMIKNTTSSLFTDADALYLMYNKNPDYLDLIRKVNTVRGKATTLTPFVSSVYFYNPSLQCFFTSDQGLYYRDQDLEKLMQDHGSSLPILKPLPMTLQMERRLSGSAPSDYFSYFLYSTDGAGRIDGAVIVNVDASWIYDSIEAMNTVGNDEAGNSILIRNDAGSFIGRYNSSDTYRKDLAAYLDASKEGIGSAELDGRRYMVTQTYIASAAWTVVKTQEYQGVYRIVTNLQRTMLLFSAFAGVVAIAVSFLMAKRIYKPVGNLVEYVMADGQDPLSNMNEFDYLRQSFTRTMDQLRTYHAEHTDNESIIRTYFLRQLLVAGQDAETLFHENRERYALKLNDKQSVLAITVFIDDYHAFLRSTPDQDRWVYRFAIMNIFEELLNEKTCCEAIDMKEENIVFLVNDTGASDFPEVLASICRRTQESLTAYFKLAVSIYISQPRPLAQISRCYDEALEIAGFFFQYGPRCVLTHDDILVNLKNRKHDYNKQRNGALTEALLAGDLERVDSVIRQIFEDISQLIQPYAVMAVYSLLEWLAETERTMHINGNSESSLMLTSIISRLHERTNLKSIRSDVMASLTLNPTSQPMNDNIKQLLLSETIQEMIEANYRDPGLCLKYIADRLHLSVLHVGKVFRQTRGISVADTITGMRMKAAVDLLRDPALCVQDIATQVGMENVSYFFKTFRKYYGMTPKQYALRSYGLNRPEC